METEKIMTDPFRKMLDERFGMFVHYGLYSGLEGYYNGKEIKGNAEWIQRFAPVPLVEYEQTGRETFCPSPDFAKNLVKAAKNAIMLREASIAPPAASLMLALPKRSIIVPTKKIVLKSEALSPVNQ